jgi:hypothetical protein
MPVPPVCSAICCIAACSWVVSSMNLASSLLWSAWGQLGWLLFQKTMQGLGKYVSGHADKCIAAEYEIDQRVDSL